MVDWKNYKILVAEDEMGNFFLISALLERTNIQITHALNGKKAVELCNSEPFELVLMDIKMPIMDGFEATKTIRKFNNNIVIIAQTAYAFKREECIAAGFTDYISKPYNKETLLLTLTQYLETQKKDMQNG